MGCNLLIAWVIVVVETSRPNLVKAASSFSAPGWGPLMFLEPQWKNLHSKQDLDLFSCFCTSHPRERQPTLRDHNSPHLTQAIQCSLRTGNRGLTMDNVKTSHRCSVPSCHSWWDTSSAAVTQTFAHSDSKLRSRDAVVRFQRGRRGHQSLHPVGTDSWLTDRLSGARGQRQQHIVVRQAVVGCSGIRVDLQTTLQQTHSGQRHSCRPVDTQWTAAMGQLTGWALRLERVI